VRREGEKENASECEGSRAREMPDRGQATTAPATPGLFLPSMRSLMLVCKSANTATNDTYGHTPGQGDFVAKQMQPLSDFPDDIANFKFPPGIYVQENSKDLPAGHHGGFDVCKKCAAGGNQPCFGLCGKMVEDRLRDIMDPNGNWMQNKQRALAQARAMAAEDPGMRRIQKSSGLNDDQMEEVMQNTLAASAAVNRMPM